MNNTKWILSVARMLIGHSVSIGQGYGVTLPTPAFHRQCTQGDATLNHHPAVRATNDAIIAPVSDTEPTEVRKNADNHKRQ